MASDTRVARVLSNPDSIIPGDIVLGDGQQSAHYDKLEGLAEDAAKAPRTDAITRVTHVIVDLSQMHRLQVQAFDKADALVVDPMSQKMLGFAQNAVVNAMPKGGYGSVMDREGAVGAERDRLALQLQGEAADAAAAKLQSKADKLQAELAADVQATRDAIELEIVEFDSLDSLSADIQLPDLSKQVSAFEEVMAKGKQALPYLLEQVESSVRLGRDLKNLRPVALKVVNKVLEDPAKWSAEEARHDSDFRWVRGPHELDADGTARRILQVLATEKESRRPETIAIALGLFRRCLQLFSAIAGQPANTLARAMQVAVPLSDLVIGWDSIDPRWLRRFLPPTGLELPGWSRIVIPHKTVKLANGEVMTQDFPVRAPAPRPLVAAPVRGLR
jgi:hypothetical protein